MDLYLRDTGPEQFGTTLGIEPAKSFVGSVLRRALFARERGLEFNLELST